MGVQFPGPPTAPVYPDPTQQGRPRRDPANRLNLEPGMNVLVVGPDPEDFVQEALDRVGTEGRVAVVTDRQETVERLETKWQKAGTDQLVVRLGPPDELPFPDDSMDRAVAARILRKGSKREGVLQEFGRVLKPGGLFGVEQRMADRGSVGPRTVKQWATAAGFESIRQYGSPLHYVLVFWNKPQPAREGSTIGHR